MKKKIILSSILTLGVLGGVVGVARFAEPVNAASEKTIYLKPNSNWTQANAWFAARCWTDSPSFSEKWYKMTDADGDGTYEALIDTTSYPKVIFTRMNPAKTALGWDSKWNQSGDLTFQNDKNLFTVKDGTWDGATATWGTYTYVEPTYYLPGSFNNWDAAADQLTDEDKNGTYEVTKELEAGTYTFKVALNGTWDISYGASTTATNNDTASITLNGNSDVSLTASGGTYTFAYTPTTKNLTITHIPAANPDEDVVELFSTYYNEGTYVKETVLNTNEFADEDVNDYFHAGAQVKYRQTTYAPGELSMVTKKTAGDAWGKHTSTYRDNGNGGVDHLTNGVKDYSVSGIVNGQDRSSVENWYVTLHDFVNTELTGWEYADGVYTLSLKDNELATKMAREFVAPMWLETEEAKNYVQFDKLTVEEVGESLVMKLYVVSTNSGQLVEGANLVFSQATITK